MTDALEKTNLELTGSRMRTNFMRPIWSTMCRTQITQREEVLPTSTWREEYRRFDTYWRMFAYIEVVVRMGELYLKFDATKLRIEFLEEVPQTPTEDIVETNAEMDQEDTLENEASSQEVSTVETPTTKASDPQPPPA